MDAPALCDSILEFVGSGLPAQEIVPKPAPAMDDDGTGGEVSKGGKAAGNNYAGPVPSAGQAEQHLQKQGLMRAFMGNKLGEFNMRGVEAGMGMINVKARKAGKLLNSGRRQRREDQSTPYGRGSPRVGKLKSKGTRATKGEAPNIEAPGAKGASSFSGGVGDSPPV